MGDGRSRLIVDANVVVHGYTNPTTPKIREQISTWLTAQVVFHVPSLWRFEVTNAIYRGMKAGAIDHDDGRFALDTILALPIEHHDERELHAEATAIALQLNAGAAYDAHYLALAQRLGVPFYTADAKLHGLASKLFPNIHLVAVE